MVALVAAAAPPAVASGGHAGGCLASQRPPDHWPRYRPERRRSVRPAMRRQPGNAPVAIPPGSGCNAPPRCRDCSPAPARCVLDGQVKHACSNQIAQAAGIFQADRWDFRGQIGPHSDEGRWTNRLTVGSWARTERERGSHRQHRCSVSEEFVSADSGRPHGCTSAGSVAGSCEAGKWSRPKLHRR